MKYNLKVEPQNSNQRNVKDNMGFIMVFTILYYFIGHIYLVPNLVMILLKNFMSINDAYIYVQMVSDSIGLIIFLIVFRHYLKWMFEIFKQNFLKSCLYGVGLYIPQLFSNAIVNFGIMFVTQIETSTNQLAATALFNSNFFALAVPAILIAPIVEELVFRGVIFNYFRKYNFTVAAFASCFAFGLLHCFSDLISGNYLAMVYILSYMAISFFFCYAYEKTDNIFTPMLLHFVNNLVAIIAMSSLM